MTDRELTKAVIAIYRKACADMEKLVNAQGVSVYNSAYGMRRWLKHGDKSNVVSSGRDLMCDVVNGRIKASRDRMLVQATLETIKKMKSKIAKDIVEDCKRSISYASSEIVKNEAIIREMVKSKQISERRLRKILNGKN